MRSFYLGKIFCKTTKQKQVNLHIIILKNVAALYSIYNLTNFVGCKYTASKILFSEISLSVQAHLQGQFWPLKPLFLKIPLPKFMPFNVREAILAL